MKLFAILLIVLSIAGCGGGGGNNNAPENTSGNISGNTSGVITLSGDDSSIVGTQLRAGFIGSSAAGLKPDYIVIVDQGSTVTFTPPNDLTPNMADPNNGFVLVVIGDELGVGGGISMSIVSDGKKFDYLCHTVAPEWSVECGVNSIFLDVENRTVSFDNTAVINTNTGSILTLNGSLSWNDKYSGSSVADVGGSPVGNGIATELEGTWGYVCLYDDAYGGTYNTDSIVFSGNTFVFTGKEYFDPDCSGEFDSYSSSGTFIIGGSIVSGSGLKAKQIDFVVDLDGYSFRYYDIFRIEGDRLYFGDAGIYDENTDEWQYDGETEETRPVELDFDFYYIRE